MSFRSLDLAKHHVNRLRFTAPLTEPSARETISMMDESADELHWRGWHPYTIDGNAHWADLHLYRRADVDDDDDEPDYAFQVTFRTGDPEDAYGEKVIRRKATAMIEAVGTEDSASFIIATLHMFFSDEDFQSPFIPSAQPVDFEQETPELAEEYLLRPAGMRFRAEEGHFDVIVDATPGPIMVRVERGIEEAISLALMRDAMRDLREIADLFVDVKPEDDDEQD